MQLGYIGLGKMGYNMVERLLEKKHQVVVYDRNQEAVQALAKKGARPAGTLKEMVEFLTFPRLIWVMIPYQAVDTVLKELVPFLQKGDTVIDGGNSPYKHSMRRAAELEARSIDFLDAGVSGGPRGAREGACIMIGGKKEVFQKNEKLFRDLAVENGFAWMGKSGAGHFVKMVHNGIEYGMMQALAEGFSILKASPFQLDLVGTADLYDHRSVIESRLVGWLKAAYEEFGRDLAGISGSAAQSGEGMWTIEAARELGIAVPIIKGALDFRLDSQKNPSYTGQVISALRNQFGGHDVREKETGKADLAAEAEVKRDKLTRKVS
jgi:6-phosphogluconate dehydrogenase